MSHISCPVEPLRRLQSEFKQLADSGCDPKVAFVTLRRPVFSGDSDIAEAVSDEPYHNWAQRRYYNEVRRRGLYARDWGWELSGQNGDPVAWRNLNKHTDENWSRQLAGWSVSDGFATIPGCERWQYIFLPENEFYRFDKICKRAATLFGNTYEAHIVEWAFGPNRPNEAHPIGVPGLWCDLVMHVALQRIPGVMLSTIATAMDEHLFPIRCMEPGDWTKAEQPPVWVAKIENFCTASVDCIDAMIANWPAQPQKPNWGFGNEALACDQRDVMLVWLSRFDGIGIPLIDVPPQMLNPDLLNVLHSDLLLEFIQRKHCHTGPVNKPSLVLEDGWEVTSNAGYSDHLLASDVLKVAIADGVESPELRVRIRLTKTGQIEASRVRLLETNTPSAKPGQFSKPQAAAMPSVARPNESQHVTTWKAVRRMIAFAIRARDAIDRDPQAVPLFWYSPEWSDVFDAALRETSLHPRVGEFVDRVRPAFNAMMEAVFNGGAVFSEATLPLNAVLNDLIAMTGPMDCNVTDELIATEIEATKEREQSVERKAMMPLVVGDAESRQGEVVGKPANFYEVQTDGSSGNEQVEPKRKRRRKRHRHQRTSEELFKSALRQHHKYELSHETGGSVLNYTPATTRQIEEITENLVSDSTARRLLISHFGSVDDYRTACDSGTIRLKLALLLGDGRHAFGSRDTTRVDVEDAGESDFDK